MSNIKFPSWSYSNLNALQNYDFRCRWWEKIGWCHNEKLLLLSCSPDSTNQFYKSGFSHILGPIITSFTHLYLVDQFISPIHEYFFNEIWCYDYFNDAVKCILMRPQDLEKVEWFLPEKNNKWINISIKKSWIGELMSGTSICQKQSAWIKKIVEIQDL